MSPRLVAITPGDHRPLSPWLAAIAPHVDVVILREPRRSSDELARLVDVVRGEGALALRHARTAPFEADGLHLPEGRPLPKTPYFGASRHDAAGVEAALAAGAAYVLLSPVWAPISKPLRGEALGFEGFCRIAADRPVLALGGVTIERVRRLAERGCGAAVLGAVFDKPDPRSAGEAAAAMRRAQKTNTSSS